LEREAVRRLSGGVESGLSPWQHRRLFERGWRDEAQFVELCRGVGIDGCVGCFGVSFEPEAAAVP
jgi:hypothetical protein